MASGTTTELAQAAYTAYGESTGGLTHDGRQMPPWEDLGLKIQGAWIAAAAAVVAEFRRRPTREA